VRPSVDGESGRVVVIGDWLHTDGLSARLKNTGIFMALEFPLPREGDGAEVETCAWRAEYPIQEAIDRRRDEMGDIGLRREMLLQMVPEEGQHVLPTDIHYYDDPPFDDGNHLVHGVGLAISTKESADYTAIVSGEVTWRGGNGEIYMQPKPTPRNKRANSLPVIAIRTGLWPTPRDETSDPPRVIPANAGIWRPCRSRSLNLSATTKGLDLRYRIVAPGYPLSRV
jgi:hypothetical protein